MERFFLMAGINLKIYTNDDEIHQDLGVFENFVIESTTPDITMEFNIVEELQKPKGECIHKDTYKLIYQNEVSQIRYMGFVQNGRPEGAYLRTQLNSDKMEVEVKRGLGCEKISANIIMNAMMAEHLLATRDGFILHASQIEYEGKAILFTAPSGIGKSTQADLWNKYRNATIINGDKSAIRIIDAKVEAWGLPFAGSSCISKQSRLPIAAIVYLSQEQETKIRRLRYMDAFRKIWEGISLNVWDAQDVEKCSDTLIKVLTQVPVYLLSCTPDESAIIALEEQLKMGG